MTASPQTPALPEKTTAEKLAEYGFTALRTVCYTAPIALAVPFTGPLIAAGLAAAGALLGRKVIQTQVDSLVRALEAKESLSAYMLRNAAKYDHTPANQDGLKKMDDVQNLLAQSGLKDVKFIIAADEHSDGLILAAAGKKEKAIIISESVFNAATPSEIRAAIAHEIAHHKKNHLAVDHFLEGVKGGAGFVLLGAIVAASYGAGALLPVAGMVLVAPFATRIAATVAAGREKGALIGGIASLAAPVAAAALFVPALLPLIIGGTLFQIGGNLMKAPQSKQREFACDRTSAQMTGETASLISVIRKSLKQHIAGHEAKTKKTYKEPNALTHALFAMHPRTETREQRLAALANDNSEAFAAVRAAFNDAAPAPIAQAASPAPRKNAAGPTSKA